MTEIAQTLTQSAGWLAFQSGGESFTRFGPTFMALLWSMPWVLVIGLTRDRRWCADRWLDLALKMQTATVSIVFAAQVSGMLGLMRWVLPWAPPVIYGVVSLLWAEKRTGPSGDSRSNRSGSSILPAMAVAMVLLTFCRLFPTSLLGAVKVVSDAPIYHLYFAAKWWLAGSIDWIPIPFGENAAPYFPANGDLVFTYLVGWTGDLTLAKVGQVPFWFFAGFLIVCLCRSLGSSRGSGIIAAAVWMTFTPLALFTFEANVDTIFAAWFLASVLFYVEYDLKYPDGDDRANDPQEPSDRANDAKGIRKILIVQSLLAAGLAWGTKAPGLVFVPPWLVFVTIREIVKSPDRSWGSMIRTTLRIWSLALAPIVFWYVRNLIATGNPLYPLPIELGGLTLADGWYGPGVMRQSPYYIPFGEWRAAVDQLLAVTDPRIIPLTVFALGWWGPRFFRPKTAQERWVGLLAIFGLATIALFWCVIPYRTQQRFFLHGLALFAPAMALCADRFRVYKFLCVIGLCLHVLTTQGWPFASFGQQTPWDMTPMIPNAVPGLAPLGELAARLLTGDWKSIGTIIMTTAVLTAWALRTKPGRFVHGLVYLSIFLGFAIMLAGEQRQFDRSGRGQRFPVFPDYERAWNAFDAITKTNPRKVAYSGTNLAIYLMGPRLANRVEYVNVNDRMDFMTHDYHLAQPIGKRRWNDPRPTWERLVVDYDAWRKNLLEKGIELVVVARANPDEGRANPYDRQGFPVERTWMDTHPVQFRPVYGVRENDPEMRIYEVVRSSR